MKPLVRIGMTICTGLLVQGAACADENAKLASLRAEITALIGPATCANLVNCRVAALGLDACGAPLEYVAYSWLSTEKDALETKIAEYNFVQGDMQNKAPAAGGCAAKLEPVAACVNRRCVIKP
jgi:hypothetical protein